jgi:hypothetical protein
VSGTILRLNLRVRTEELARIASTYRKINVLLIVPDCRPTMPTDTVRWSKNAQKFRVHPACRAALGVEEGN